MKQKVMQKISLIGILISFGLNAQFRNLDRMNKLEGFDESKFSWGFFINANNFDYKLDLNPKTGISNHHHLVTSQATYSFGAGLIGKMRLHENIDLRLEPGLQFVERKMTFERAAIFSKNLVTQNVKSTYIDLPLLVEVHGARWYNSRPYVALGGNWMLNLQSNEGSTDDNQQGVFRTTSSNLAWSAEAGIQFYFSRFKLTPAFRGTFMINNELVPDNPSTPPYWAGGLSSARTRALMFILKFE